MRQHSFWSWEMSVSMSAVGFAALALAAGLWALRKARKGGGRRKVAPTVQIPSLSEVSDDEEDDLWDHVASILESRRKSGASVQAKQSAEEDEEVWRIVEQIVSSRKHSHPWFQSPEKASSLSVKELRRWFESQAAERADSVDGQSESGHCKNGQCENGQCKSGDKENGHWDESNRKVNGLSDETVSSDSDLSEQGREGANLLGEKGDISGTSEDGTKGAALVAASNGSGGHERTPAASPPRVKKIVRRQKSPPKEFQDLEEPSVTSLVVEDKQSGARKDEIESDKVDPQRKGGSDSSQNRGSALSQNGESNLSKKGGSVIEQSEGSISVPNERALLEDGSETGGPGYQGPPGGEERVVVYMTSMRAVRKTFEECTTVRHIFNGFSIAVDERDISIHLPYRQELRDLMGGRLVSVPQVFIRGKHIGGLQEVRYLTDEKKMHKLIEGMPKIKVTEECEGCGGGRFLPCIDCRGSRKILVDEKIEPCNECNEYGLIRCPMCA